MDLPLHIPAPPGHKEPPVWTGRGFALNQSVHRVLCYETGSSGWTDELTELHEGVDDEQHYMNAASREHAVSRLSKWLRNSEPVVIDIGCSSGYMVKCLRQSLPLVTVLAADYVRGPLEKLGAAIPDVPLLQFDLTKCPLPDKSVDGVILLNVLEHIKDDFAAVHQVQRILKEGGIAVVEVPAGPNLFDIYDEQLLHFRRYRMKELLEKLRRVGLEVLEHSHLGFFLYPAFWFVKKRNQRFMRESPEVKKRIVSSNMRQARTNLLVSATMQLENRLRDWISYPFGIRCLVTCRRVAER
jgi:SAM-dependent methyltransferase